MASCDVCTLVQHKYKCPTCLMKYCSVTCYKQHKGASDQCVKKVQQITDDVIRATSPQPSENLLDAEQSDRVSEDLLNRLENSKKLQEILQNRELRELIREIDGHSRPPDKLKIAMHLPVFREFVDECLAVCDQSTLSDNASPDTSPNTSCTIYNNYS